MSKSNHTAALTGKAPTLVTISSPPSSFFSPPWKKERTESGEIKYGQQVTANLVDGKIAFEFGVFGLPETYIVNNKGKIIFKHAGALTKAIIDDEITKLF